MKTTMLILPLLLAGCISKQRCNELFPPSVHTEHTTTIIQRDSIIKGATVYDTLHLRDTLILRELRERIVIKHDTSGRAELRYWVDEAGRLRLQCTSKDATVQWLERHVATTTVETRKEMPTWVYFAMIAIVLFIIFLIWGR